ncbi:hypothetical protein H257_03955 [Aphanomyces astaci]|uniref:Uncharacterized protein n=1 Tax=Aphanomyces astaci TaxID=112090 RepID=W4GW74_APHAT|nr:hypothetical protein H257_03955 [Aphanomyces astaci]ETV83153.1 hypothetical protein H257_03955 [Aphanomyces astaci]|eukprot:XP_009826583.1 hypothetical protein H257_03955 [Aphanomyces astaci]
MVPTLHAKYERAHQDLPKLPSKTLLNPPPHQTRPHRETNASPLRSTTSPGTSASTNTRSSVDAQKHHDAGESGAYVRHAIDADHPPPRNSWRKSIPSPRKDE